MSIESAQAFVQRMTTDEGFAKRVVEAESREDRWTIVKAEGYDFTLEEIEVGADELSDLELAAVTGGMGGGCAMCECVGSSAIG